MFNLTILSRLHLVSSLNYSCRRNGGLNLTHQDSDGNACTMLVNQYGFHEQLDLAVHNFSVLARREVAS